MKINDFDKNAEQTLFNLCQSFNTSFTKRPDLISPYSIGIEIEVKFKYFFPSLFSKYFEGKKYFHYTEEERNLITKETEEVEKDILPQLLKTIECGIPRGLDRYWEFSFTPVYNLSLLSSQIEVLKSLNLIPEGEHSLHISIGNLKNIPDVYYILMVMELLFVKKERIMNGFSKDKSYDATWSKKGFGGICVKNEHDLIDSNIGFEFRSLCLYNDTDIYFLFELLTYFLNRIFRNEQIPILEEIKNKMLSYGLPNSNWKKPYQNSEIWDLYINVFDDFSEFTKSLILKEFELI